jgi:hypothetical protein
MVFGMMGSPLYEHFEAEAEAESSDTMNYYNCDDKHTMKNSDGSEFCEKRTSAELSNDQNEFTKWDTASANYDDSNFNCEKSITDNENRTYCKKINDGGNGKTKNKKAEDGEEEGEEDGVGEGEGEEDGEEEKDGDGDGEGDEEDGNNPTTENFSGSMNIEHFSGANIKEKVLSLNLLLKSLLFACLFYIIAHPDTKTYLLKNLKCLKSIDYLVVSMIIFFICYYILNIFV